MTDDLECSPYVRDTKDRTPEEARADMDRNRRESGLCPVCGKHRALAEVEVCRHCYDDAQANVVDLVAQSIGRMLRGEEVCLRQIRDILRRPDHAEQFTMEDIDKAWGEMRVLVERQLAQPHAAGQGGSASGEDSK